MDYLKILLSSVFSISALFILTRIIGNRQVSELSLFDYINGITIGSIAAEMATELEKNIMLPLLAMVVYGLATVGISLMCSKSIVLRRFFGGKAIIIYHGGSFCLDGLKRSRLDINEFLTQCRVNGYFSLDDIDTAIMEPNGMISFLPTATARTITVNDMALTVKEQSVEAVLISDGKILEENLINASMDKKELLCRMNAVGISSLSSVMLGVLGSGGEVKFYKKNDRKAENEIFI